MNYIYVMKEVGYFGLPTLKYKIGISKIPKSRRRNMQTGNPDLLVTVSITKIGSRRKAKKVENKVHDWLSFLHIRGEWFWFPPFLPLTAIVRLAKWTTL